MISAPGAMQSESVAALLRKLSTDGKNLAAAAAHKGIRVKENEEPTLVKNVQTAADCMLSEFQTFLTDYNERALTRLTEEKCRIVERIKSLKADTLPDVLEVFRDNCASNLLKLQHKSGKKFLCADHDLIQKVKREFAETGLTDAENVSEDIDARGKALLACIEKEQKTAFEILNQATASTERIGSLEKALQEAEECFQRGMKAAQAELSALKDVFSTKVCAIICEIGDAKGRLLIEAIGSELKVRTDVPLHTFLGKRVEVIIGNGADQMRVVIREKAGVLRAKPSRLPLIACGMGKNLAAAFQERMKTFPEFENHPAIQSITSAVAQEGEFCNFLEVLKGLREAPAGQTMKPDDRLKIYENFLEELRKLELEPLDREFLIFHLASTALKDNQLYARGWLRGCCWWTTVDHRGSLLNKHEGTAKSLIEERKQRKRIKAADNLDVSVIKFETAPLMPTDDQKRLRRSEVEKMKLKLELAQRDIEAAESKRLLQEKKKAIAEYFAAKQKK